MSGGVLLGVDIGGTFTDFTMVDSSDGTLHVDKILTSTDAADRAVLQGVDGLCSHRADSSRESVVHATTLVTNTIIERKGALTGLLTTAGFRDLLEIQREVRYDLYDLFIRMPRPIVPRRLRIGVTERVQADGKIRVPLNEEDVRAAARQFREAGVDAVAVLFLHSYRNPAHERRAGEILRAELPEAVISLSHQVHPQPKEYERGSTTVLDAYVKRVVESYLDRLSEGLSDRRFSRLYLMLSNGGTTTAEHAKAVPIQLVESGPAAGVEAASYFGRVLGIDRILSFDMGGTTAKLCLIENGRAERTHLFEVDRMKRFKSGSGLPVNVPVYDLLEIGAGGGSIARINSLGLLQVGPDSAGATPGPVCYGNGGSEPTVTDADLILGYLDEGSFLGGAIRLDRSAAEAAISSLLAQPGKLSTERAARGVFEVVNETMASAARQYVAEKGRGPSELTMVAFGGAGPVHALGLARKVGIPRVVVPPLPGVMSSLGLLAAPVAFERGHAVRRLIAELKPHELDRLLDRIADEARRLLPADAHPELIRFADMRYSGQDHTLEVVLPAGSVDGAAIAKAVDAFIRQYLELYGKIDDDNPVEVASVRVVLTQQSANLKLPAPETGSPSPPIGRRRIFGSDGVFLNAPVFQRSTLKVGQLIAGPALIEERESTTVLDDGDRLTVDVIGALVIDVALPHRSEETMRPVVAGV